MSDSTLESETVQEQIPNRWRVEDDGDSAVYGYADGYSEVDLANLPWVPAAFAIRKADNNRLWEATWKSPHELGDDIDELSEHIHGTRERCVEWIAGKARSLGEHTNE